MPPPEPTVEIGDVIYVDTSEQDAAADAAASGPPKKRTKLTSGHDAETIGKRAQMSRGDDDDDVDVDVEMQIGDYGGHDEFEWNDRLEDAPQAPAEFAAQPVTAASKATDAFKTTIAMNSTNSIEHGAVLNGSGPLTAAAALIAFSQSGSASAPPVSLFDDAVRAPVSFTNAPSSTSSAYDASAVNIAGMDDADEPLDFMIDTPASDLLAASVYAPSAANSLFRRMVKQDPVLERLAEESMLALPSQIPSQPPAAEIDASCQIGSSRDLQAAALPSSAASGPVRATTKRTKTFQSRQPRKPSSTNGASTGGMPYRAGAPNGSKSSSKR